MQQADGDRQGQYGHALLDQALDLAAGLFPAEGAEFFFGADELDRAAVEQDAAPFRVMVVKREQFRSAMLVPARLRLKQLDHLSWRIWLAVRVHGVVGTPLTRAGAPMRLPEQTSVLTESWLSRLGQRSTPFVR